MSQAAQEQRVGDLYVQVIGEGAPVLLLHGNSGDLHYFDGILPALRARRVVAMDCRGQGKSDRGDGPLTIARMAEDAADVIRATRPHTDQPFDVVGFSDGANVAMVLASRHPELVRSLVLNAGNITPHGLKRGLHLQLQAADAFLRLRLWRNGPLRLPHELIRLMLDAPGVSADDLRGIRVPTLVVAGSRDVIRPAHTRRIAALIPDARLHIVDGGTHFVLRDQPEVVGAMIAAFLDDVDRSAG